VPAWVVGRFAREGATHGSVDEMGAGAPISSLSALSAPFQAYALLHQLLWL